MHSLDDTIAAIASPPGGAARGIIRLSGPIAHQCAMQFFEPAVGRVSNSSKNVGVAVVLPPPSDGQGAAVQLPPQRTVIEGALRLPGLFSPLPCDLYLWPDRRSYTGQPVAEIHTLGSPPLLDAALRTLCAAGARPAEPGEFTLRAFLAGRIDLTQAEAVLGVIDAADPRELHVALSQLAGGLAGPLHRLRETLVELLAHLEAGLDFADEDVAFIAPAELRRQLADAARNVAALARQMASRSETAQRPRVVLVGRPNSGKSSLFNALIGHAGALVSEHPGTTRDYLTAELHLDGIDCRLIDTAGVGATGVSPVFRDEHGQDARATIETAASAASIEQRAQAHVRVLCLDATQSAACRATFQFASKNKPVENRPYHDTPCIVAWTKADAARPDDSMPGAVATSSISGEGLDALRAAIRAALLGASAAGGEVVSATAVRCRRSLALAARCLARARKLARARQSEELVAAEIRAALEELGKVVGAVYTDDILDRIFSRFCIGK
jgi:tRNA modification GTPase